MRIENNGINHNAEMAANVINENAENEISNQSGNRSSLGINRESCHRHERNVKDRNG